MQSVKKKRKKFTKWKASISGKIYVNIMLLLCCWRCPYCKKRMHNSRNDDPIYKWSTKASIDHKTPLSKGGDNSIKNLRVICQGCNFKINAQEQKNDAHTMHTDNESTQ